MRLIALALAMAPALLTGCGPCQKIASHRDTFHGRSVTGSQPHLAVLVPQKLIDDGIARGIAGIQPKGINVPGLGDLGRYVGQFMFKPKRVSVQKAAEGRYRIQLDLDVALGNRSLFQMGLATETRPQTDAKKGELVLPFRADMLSSVTPTISGGAGAKLASAVLARLPGAVRLVLPRGQINRLADTAIAYLSDHAVRLLNAQVLTPMGELATFKFKMPNLPLASLQMASVPGGLEISMRTTLPVAGGLPPMSRAARSRLRTAPSDEIQVRFATAAVVELANWGISRGDIPGTYNMQGKADEQGTFTAGLEWAGGERPLKLNAWSTEGACIRARIGAKPRVALVKGKLDIGVDDAQVEEIEGPPLISTAAEWAQGLWGDSIKSSKTRLEASSVGLGKGATKGLALERIALQGDVMMFTLRTGKAAPKKGSTRRGKRVSQALPAAPGRCGD
jgi:hypothetical protein